MKKVILFSGYIAGSITEYVPVHICNDLNLEEGIKYPHSMWERTLKKIREYESALENIHLDTRDSVQYN
jgi:hypothetical protein